MSTNETSYCWSIDEENYKGEFPTVEEALAEATESLCCDFLPGAECLAWVGEPEPAINYLRSRKQKYLGDDIVESLDIFLFEEIGGEDAIIDISQKDCAELAKMVVDFLEDHATFHRWGVKNIQKHEVVLPK